MCGSDGTNVDVGVAAEQLVLNRRSGVLTTLVHLDDEDLWWTLTTAAVGSDNPQFRLEFFNVADRAARAMLVEHSPFPPPGERSLHHVLLVGLHGIGRPLALRIAGAFRAAADERRGERLRMTFAGSDAAEHVEALRRRYPEIDEVCTLHAVEDPEDLEELATMSYVCASDEARALSIALALRAGAGRIAPVVIAVSDEESGVARALRAEGRALEGIEPFGVLSHALTPDLIEYAETEMLARLKHEEYLEAEARRGRTNPPLDDKSLLPWSELPDSLKESNRRFADGISKKLQDSNCILVPAPLVDPRDPGFAFTDDEVEPLAIKEHDRWMADLQRDGWTHTTGPKDPDHKRHPLLVPWDQLSEENKDRDRDPVREVPRMLARLGFRVIRLEPDEPAPALPPSVPAAPPS